MAHAKIRVLIGAGSFSDAVSALQIAGDMAADMLTDLGGLLIEEADFIAACALPNRRVISLTGASVIAPSPAQVRMMINADARAFRQQLADIARPPLLGWSFEQQTGDLIECMARAGRAWDVMIIGHRALHPVHGQIIYLGTPSAQDGGALWFSERLAEKHGTRVVRFLVDDGGTPQTMPDGLRFGTLDAALLRLARTNVQAVVTDLADGPVHSKEHLRSLLDAARCPVVVFGASSLEPALEHSTHIPPAPRAGPA